MADALRSTGLELLIDERRNGIVLFSKENRRIVLTTTTAMSCCCIMCHRHGFGIAVHQRILAHQVFSAKISVAPSVCYVRCAQMPFRRLGFRRIVRVDENGGGKLFFIFMVSAAFAISGILDREPKLALWSLNTSSEGKQLDVGNQGWRYCDPPDVTSPAIYFDSREETNADDDYDLFRNQEMYFQTNLSLRDRAALKTEIFSDLGSSASYVPAFFLASKFGSQRTLGYSILFLLFTIVFNKNIYLEGFLKGFGLGGLEYSFYLMTFHYVSSGRNSIISLASVRHIGLVVIELLLVTKTNRRYALYVAVIVTVAWFIGWSIINFKSSRNEIHYLRQKKRSKGSRRRFPWKDVLGSRPVWMTITAIFGASSGLSCIFTAMKLYLKYIYYLQDKNMLGLSSLLHVGFAIICGLSFDYLFSSHKLSMTSLRRMVVYVSHFIPAGLIFILGFLGCSQGTPVVFYFLAVMITGANYTGAFSSPLDLAPKYSGHILALCFTFKALGCLFMDYFILYVLTEQVFMSWRFIFSLNALILLLSAIFFMLRGSGSVQVWNDPDDKLIREKRDKKIQRPQVSVISPLPKPRTKSIYMVEKKILKVLHVQEPDKFTRVRAYSTSLPNERRTTGPPNIYRPIKKKRASIS